MSDERDWNIQAEPDSAAPAEPAAHPHSGPRWMSLLALFAFLLALRFVVPYLAEEISYSID